ncbi:rhomboid family intramembrane serine protease [Actinoallomurus acanthiterrae]
MADLPTTVRSPEGGIVHHASRALGAVFITVALLGACWAVEVANYGGDLTRQYGIQPHNVHALWHIFTAPFLHANLDHIVANSVPLAIFGFLTALRGLGRFIAVSVITIVVSGLGVWFLSPSNVVTVGASGLIFGYFGYLLARGFFERRVLDILLGVAIALVYGTMIFGVLPGQPGISWQAHLFGLIGGVVAARLTRQRA